MYNDRFAAVAAVATVSVPVFLFDVLKHTSCPRIHRAESMDGD